ncbi:MAG: winged helix-turn-helix domain-containing protein [Thermoanaerobaculia bacterium]
MERVLKGDSPAAPFQVGEFRVEPGLDRIVGANGAIAVEPRAMDLLLFLAAHPGQTLTKEQLLDTVWKGASVVEGVLPKTIFALRHALGDHAENPRYILNVPRRGYRLIAAVTALPGALPTALDDLRSAEVPAAADAADAAAPAPPERVAAEPELTQVDVRAGRRGSAVVAYTLLAVFGTIAVALTVARFRDDPVAPDSSAGASVPSGVTAQSVEKVLLEARLLWSRRDPADVTRAYDLLRQAAREAPESAEVRGWLALALVIRANYVGSTLESFEQAENEADRALKLDPRSAVAHCAKGLVALNRRLSLGEAVAEQRRALELDPQLVVAHQFLAEALSAAGQNDEARQVIEAALQLEPLSPVLHGVEGLVLLRADLPLAALDAFDRVLVLAPQFGWVHRYRAYSLARLGRPMDAADALYKEAEALKEDPAVLARLRADITRSGLPGYWKWRLERVEVMMRSRGWVPRPSQYAEALAGVGRYDEALAQLRAAPAAGDGEYFLYFRDSPAFDPIRDRPEFRAIYSR